MLLVLALVLAGAASPPEMTRLAQSRSAGPFALGAGATRIPLDVVQPAALAQSVQRAGAVYLVFAGLHADAPPGVVFDIYLTPPDGAAAASVGTLNFFAATDLAPGRSAGRPTVSLDVTARMRVLAAGPAPAASLDVALVPAGAPAAGSHPVVMLVTLVAQ